MNLSTRARFQIVAQGPMRMTTMNVRLNIRTLRIVLTMYRKHETYISFNISASICANAPIHP